MPPQLYADGVVGTSYYLADGNSRPITVTSPSLGRVTAAALRGAANAFPGFGAAFRRYGLLYKSLKPTLLLIGGLPAVIRAKPELGRNADAWFRDNDLALIIPIAAQVLMQTGCVELLQACVPQQRRGHAR
jgi:hypothetical protein